MRQFLFSTFMVLLVLMFLTPTSLKAQGFDVGVQKKAILNVSVIPMDREVVLANQTVLFEGDRIVKIGSTEEIEVGDDYQTIDGRGKYLIPGLVDTHVHVSYDTENVVFYDAPLYVNYGVTTVLNLWDDGKALAIRNQIRNNELAEPMPWLYTAGPYVSPSRPVPFTTPEEIEVEARRQKAAGYDLLKMHDDGISEEAFRHLHRIAREIDMRVVGHAPRTLSMDHVYEEKQDLVHAEEYMYTSFGPMRTPLWGKIMQVNGLILVAFLLTAIITGITGIARMSKRRPRGPIGYFHGKFSLFLLLGFGILVIYFFLAPPLFPFFLNMPIMRYVLLALTVSTFIFAIRIGMRALELLKNKDIHIASKVYVLLFSVMMVVYVGLSGFWNKLVWLTTDSAIERVAQETADAGISVCPNMISYKYIADQLSPEKTEEFRQRDYNKYITARWRQYWYAGEQSMKAIRPIVAPGFQKQVDLMRKLVGQLNEKGVLLTAGSDVGVRYVFPGFSLHEELELLVSAGLSPYEALKAGTANGAEFLEAADEFGMIKEGLRADLILLNANPLDDILNSREIEGVMVRGKWLSRADIDQTFARLEEERR